MKALTYHYVRPAQAALPDFRYLHVEDFRRQLDWLGQAHGFVARAAFERSLETHEPADGVVLTFDDGLSDHYDQVFPELVRRGLWGIFYVSTGTYRSNRLLDVHRIHILLGRNGGAEILRTLLAIVEDHMLVDKDSAAFRSETYRHQDNDAATTEVKRILNYYISYAHRTEVLDRLWAEFVGNGVYSARRFYLSIEQVREMADAGMVIGSHSVSHPVFSKLEPDAQWAEIDSSFSFLEDVLGEPVETFCYPYGGFHNFTDETQRLLRERGCRYAFNVEPRDIEPFHLSAAPMALPRYDCNMMRFGTASRGAFRPVEDKVS